MASPLTFLRSFRAESVRSLLLVQSSSAELALRAAARLRALFPGADIDAVLREHDCPRASDCGFGRVFVVRWEDRLDVVRALRAHTYDAVVVLTGRGGSDYLRLLPLLLRTRSILLLNENLDYFPLHVSRLRTLAFHLSGRDGVSGLLVWASARLVIGTLAALVLLGSTLRLRAVAARRGWRTRPAAPER